MCIKNGDDKKSIHLQKNTSDFDEHVHQTINKEHLYSAILAGAEKVSLNREALNNANAFPVPDRDTGNNLSYLMQYIVKNLDRYSTIHETMSAVSNAAIMGARGNSGAIFSQFFNGFKEAAPKATEMTMATMVECFQRGYYYAYSAVQEPQEGTIITAIRSWAEGLKNNFKANISLSEMHKHAFSILKETVNSTRYTLEAQRKLKTEDAGAMAFLYFIDGFMKIIINKVVDYTTHHFTMETPPLIESHFNNILSNTEYRYCTEVLFKKTTRYNKKALQAFLKSCGDSVVISENEQLARVHVHSNHPQNVVEKLFQWGTIVECKADDMYAQQNLTKTHPTEFALIIDSIADLPQNNLPDFVYFLPINLIVDGITYIDKRTSFTALVDKSNASSSQPNYAQVEALLKPVAQSYLHVFVLTVSSRMSGVYSQFKQVIEKHNLNNVTLMDTKRNSVAEGLIAKEALDIINQNKSVKKTKIALQDIIERTEIFVSLNHLKAMISSGRLNQKIGWFLKRIGFLPLITINDKGDGAIKGVSFSKSQNVNLLIDTVKKQKDVIEKYALVHANAPEKVNAIAERLTKTIGYPPCYIDEISSVTRLFSGKGSVAVGIILKRK